MSFLDSIFSDEADDLPEFPAINTPTLNIQNGTATPTEGSAFLASRDRLPDRLADLDALRGAFAIGDSEGRNAGLLDVEQQFGQAEGTLRSKLAKRKVLGSSFANDDLARLAGEKARTRSDTIRKSFLEEFAAISDTIKTEANLLTSFMASELSLAGLAFNTAQAIDRNAQFRAQLAAEEAKARAEGLFAIGGLAMSQFGAGGMFGKFGAFPGAVSGIMGGGTPIGLGDTMALGGSVGTI